MEHYKDRVCPGDVVLFCDIDFPGFVATFTHLIKTQIPNVKIYGYLHAGSYCKDDLFCNTPGKLQTEMAYLSTFDGIFVGSEYHKSKFCGLVPSPPGERATLQDKIHVVGAPFYKSQLSGVRGKKYKDRKFDVIYPSRIDLQKKANTFLDLVNRFPDIKFVCTHNPGTLLPNLEYQHPEDREGYYKLLANSRTCLSLAKEETFGYIALEAMAVGTVPIAPDKYSYPEILKDMWATMYTRDEGIPLAVRQALEMTKATTNPFWYSRVDEMEHSIPKMIKIMLGE
jgi:glycosyltransferase involved in cell wall biosynthesis